MLPLSELLIFMAVRSQHMEEVIMPALARGAVVVCDRFVDATYAYQGYGRGVDLGIIATLNRLVTKGVTPNLTILLDCDVDVGLKGNWSIIPSRTGSSRKRPLSTNRSSGATSSWWKRTRRGFLWSTVSGISRRPIMAIRDRVERLLESHGV